MFGVVAGVSRSAATILGGMIVGAGPEIGRRVFFFCRVPLLLAAGAFDLLNNLDVLTGGDLKLLGIGLAVSFVSAWAAIRFFIRFVSRNTQSPFGWYRLPSPRCSCCLDLKTQLPSPRRRRTRNESEYLLRPAVCLVRRLAGSAQAERQSFDPFKQTELRQVVLVDARRRFAV